MRGEAWNADTDDTAVVWASKIQNGSLSEAEADALNDWLAGNPHRLAALASARAAGGSVVRAAQGAEPTPERYLSRRRFLTLALAAGAGIGLVSGGLLYLSGRHRYSTAVGEMGHVLLPDGSMAILNTTTEIALAFTPTDRYVRLVRGEALFDVELDTLRLFSLEASGLLVETYGAPRPTTIRKDHTGLGALIDYGRDIARPLTQQPSRVGFEARGTTFTSKITRAGGVEIGVLEGTVEVRGRAPRRFDTRALTANSMLRALSDGHPDTFLLDTRSLESRLAWLRRMVVFDKGTTIRDAAEEFNRYNELRLLVDGPIANTQIRGQFDIDRPVDFARTVELMSRAKVRVGNREVTIAR